MPIIPPGYCLVQAFYSDHAGHNCMNSCGYAYESVSNPNDEALSVSLSLVDSYLAQLSNGSYWNGVRLLIGQDGGDPLVGTAGAHNVGSRTGEMVPPNVQGLIRKSTAYTGRAHRGRLFVPDLEENHVSGAGILDSTALGRLAVIAAAWANLGADSDGPTDPVILHTASSEAPTFVTGMEAQSVACTLRNRFDR
jgi:hypothetical protein